MFSPQQKGTRSLLRFVTQRGSDGKFAFPWVVAPEVRISRPPTFQLLAVFVFNHCIFHLQDRGDLNSEYFNFHIYALLISWNTDSLIQPFDQKIIAYIKGNYRKGLIKPQSQTTKTDKLNFFGTSHGWAICDEDCPWSSDEPGDDATIIAKGN